MAHAPYVLAKTLREAHDFARDVLGLSRGRYRVVTAPSTLSAVRNADLHLVPGYEKRHDRFAMRGALRYTRMNKIEHDVAEVPADPIDTPATEVDVAAFFEFPVQITGVDVADLTPQQLAEMMSPSRIMVIPEEPNFGTLTEAELADLAVRDAAAPLTEQDIAELTALANEAEAPVEPEVKRRRRRCGDCGILVEPDEVEAHASSHAEVE